MQDNTITEQWLAEFRGLFWGEGNADVQLVHRSERGQLYRPRLRIGLRDDDREILEDIQRKLGGTLTMSYKKGYGHPAVTWTAANKETVKWVAELLLQGAMPSKKCKEVELVREAAALRAGKQGWVSDGERVRLKEIYETLRKFKQYV